MKWIWNLTDDRKDQENNTSGVTYSWCCQN